MVHPCIPSDDDGVAHGFILHAYSSGDQTVCGVPLNPSDVDQTAGATRLCRRCYPKVKGADPVGVGDK